MSGFLYLQILWLFLVPQDDIEVAASLLDSIKRRPKVQLTDITKDKDLTNPLSPADRPTDIDDVAVKEEPEEAPGSSQDDSQDEQGDHSQLSTDSQTEKEPTRKKKFVKGKKLPPKRTVSRDKENEEFPIQEKRENDFASTLSDMGHDYFKVPLTPPPLPEEKGPVRTVLAERTRNKVKPKSKVIKPEPYIEPYIEPPKPTFKIRSTEEDDRILSELYNRGVDSEDLRYLKEAFDSLQQMGSDLLKGLTWADHPGILFIV